MARATADLFFSQVLLEFLQHADSEAAGVPAEAVLPKLVMDSGQLQTLPGLVISAEEAPGSSQHKHVLNFVLAILFKNRAVGEDAATDAASLGRSMTATEAAQMLDAVESRLMDRAAFGAFLAGLSEERRTGWKILKWRRLAQPQLRRQEKPTAHQTRMCAFEMQVVWSRQSGG